MQHKKKKTIIVTTIIIIMNDYDKKMIKEDIIYTQNRKLMAKS